MSGTIESLIRRFLVESFGFRGATPDLGGDVDLLEGGIVDSTDVLEIVAYLERELAVVVEDSELVPENFGSINRVVAFIERKQRPAAPAD